eukprot:7350438-Prymnesium_polylepis.1
METDEPAAAAGVGCDALAAACVPAPSRGPALSAPMTKAKKCRKRRHAALQRRAHEEVYEAARAACGARTAVIVDALAGGEKDTLLQALADDGVGDCVGAAQVREYSADASLAAQLQCSRAHSSLDALRARAAAWRQKLGTQLAMPCEHACSGCGGVVDVASA